MSFFLASEFRCRCGQSTCNARTEPSSDLLERLNRLREYVEAPIVIASGIRCERWNALNGGVKGSAHLTGEAADLRCIDSAFRWSLLAACFREALFTRLGVNRLFIHVDVSHNLSQNMVWVYETGI